MSTTIVHAFEKAPKTATRKTDPTHNGTIAAIGLSGGLPLLMASTGFPAPSSDVASWIPWVISVGGPLVGWGLTLGARVVSAYVREKARTIRNKAQAALDDKDPTNDDQARADLAKAAGMDAAADVLEQRQRENRH